MCVGVCGCVGVGVCGLAFGTGLYPMSLGEQETRGG